MNDDHISSSYTNYTNNQLTSRSWLTHAWTVSSGDHSYHDTYKHIHSIIFIYHELIIKSKHLKKNTCERILWLFVHILKFLEGSRTLWNQKSSLWIDWFVYPNENIIIRIWTKSIGSGMIICGGEVHSHEIIAFPLNKRTVDQIEPHMQEKSSGSVQSITSCNILSRASTTCLLFIAKGLLCAAHGKARPAKPSLSWSDTRQRGLQNTKK